MNRTHLPPLRRAVLLACAAAFVLPSLLHAQSIEWIGVNNGLWTNSANWSPETTLDGTSSGADITVISAAGATTMNNTMIGANIAVNSVTFNNHLGHLIGSNTAVGYRVIGGVSSGGFRFDTGNQDIITLTHNANVSFNANASQSITLNLNYTGTATINVVDASSVMTMTVNGTVITGTGGLIKAGAGTLRIGGNQNATLPGLGNYTGGFELRDGGVHIAFNGNATTSAFGTGTLILSGGTLASTTATAKTIFNNITLNGSVALTESTASTFSGNLTISDNSGTRSTTLAADSTLDVVQTVTWNQTIGESGGARSLTKTGAGTLALNGANTYTGGTVVSAGTLTGDVAGGDLSVASGATYGLGSASRSVGTLSGSGAITLGAHTLTVGSAADSSFSGGISGTGAVTKEGSGTLTLSGTNAYTGLTTVAAGTLAVEGSLAGNLAVDSGASLTGSGTVAGSASISGHHNPGSSPGIQSFGGDLTYQAGATVTWELTANSTAQDNPALFDQIAVGGTLDFAGATLMSLAFNAAGSTVDWNSALWDADQAWLIYSSAALTNSSNLAISSANWADGFGNLFDTVRPDSAFFLSSTGSDIYLNYTAIPEPSTYAALLGAAALALAAWRRRRNTRVAA